MVKLVNLTELRIELMNTEMKIEILNQRIKTIRNIIIADVIIVLLAIIFTR